MGFIFQQCNLIPVLTALENVELPLKLTTALEAGRPGRPAGTLSAPAFRRPGAACRHRPRDRHRPRSHPGGRADGQSRRRIGPGSSDDSLEAAEFGKTIVMVTYDPHAAGVATMVRHLEKGELMVATVASEK